MEQIIIESSNVEISELTSHPDYLNAKFVICDFGVNKNGVKLNRDTIEDWMTSLVDAPVVGKVVKNFNNKEDFTSHNLKIVSSKGKDGKIHKQAVFDTNAFGVFTSVEIEEIDGVEYIVANAKIWKRFTSACQIIQDRADNLKTSWEISIENSTLSLENGKTIKTINQGRFIGLALLSKTTPPAYDSSGLLEVASEQENELDTALIEDLQNLDISSDIKKSTDKEVNMEKDNVEVLENSTEQNNISENNDDVKDNEVVESAKETDKKTKDTKVDKDTGNTEESKCKDDDDKEKSEVKGTSDSDGKEKSDATEVSALTDSDLRRKLEREFDKLVSPEGCRYCGWCFMLFPADNTAWFKECGRETETELVEIKYTVENDNVTITENNQVTLTVSPREINQAISQKDSAIAEMSAQIKSLTDEVSALQPYKTKVEEIEKAEKEAKLEQDRKELSEYAISSGHITAEEIETSEEIKQLINDLNKSGIQSIISDRVVSALANKEKDETKVETSETKSNETNIKVNLSAVDSNAESGAKVNAKDARKAIRNYIGRK